MFTCPRYLAAVLGEGHVSTPDFDAFICAATDYQRSKFCCSPRRDEDGCHSEALLSGGAVLRLCSLAAGFLHRLYFLLSAVVFVSVRRRW